MSEILKGCIFCAGKPLSAEHIWPKKLRKYTGPLAKEYIEFRRSSEVDLALQAVEISANRRRQGRDPASTSRRIVCASCNNGWMSNLQNQAIDLLAPVIQGQEAKHSVADLQKIAAFAVLFAICRQFAYQKAAPVVRSVDLANFFKSRTPDHRWKIWMAPYSGSEWKKSAANMTFRMDLSNERSESLYCVTFAIGKVAFHIVYSSDKAYESYFQFPEMQSLWPVTDTAPVRDLDDHRLERIHFFMKVALSPMQLVIGQPPFICGRRTM